MFDENTTAPKKSFLTRVMEDAAAKKAAKESDNVTPISREAALKQAQKRFGLVLVGTIAATAAVIVIANKLVTDETSPEAEETSSND